MRIDPNGAFDTKADAKQYAKDNDMRTRWFSRNKIEKADDGSFAINNKREHTSVSNDKDFGIIKGVLAEGQRGGPKSESRIWNEFTNPNNDADMINIGADFAFLGGGGYQFQAVRINKGKDAGWHYYHTTDANIGYGGDAGISVSSVDFNENYDRGQVELRAADFEGNGNNYSARYGVMSFGYGYTTTDGKHTMNPAVSNKLYTTKTFGIGPGLGYYWQGTNSKIIK